MSARTVTTIVVFVVLWVAWCFFAIGTLTPWVELHVAFWHWFIAWILCALPLILLAAFLVLQARRGRV